MKTNLRWYEISGGILLIAVTVCMLLFSAISLAEGEMRAAMFSFGVFLLLCVAIIIIINLKRRGALESVKAQRTVKAALGIITFFIAILFIPTDYYTPKKSCGTTELAGQQARYDSRKQPGAKLFVQANKTVNSDELTLTVYDICVGKISHKIRRDGPVNPQRIEILDRNVLTEKIKDEARSFGAQVVGVTELKPQYVFSHDVEGNPIAIHHKYAIVIGVGMNYRLASPSAPLPWEDYYSALPEDIAAELSGLMVRSSTKVPRKVVDEVREAMQFFSEGGSAAVQLAKYVRSMGYPARAHLHNRAGEVQIIPLAIEAGLGEMGKNGMLITKEFGPRGSFCVVTTDLPLVPDRFVDMGVKDFCMMCNKCARSCPVQAIPYGDPRAVNGVVKWPLDGEKCFEFLASNPKCMACIGSCPYNKQDYFIHRMAIYMISRKSIITNYLMVRLDDALGYGKASMIYAKKMGNAAAADGDTAK